MIYLGVIRFVDLFSSSRNSCNDIWESMEQTEAYRNSPKLPYASCGMASPLICPIKVRLLQVRDLHIRSWRCPPSWTSTLASSSSLFDLRNQHQINIRQHKKMQMLKFNVIIAMLFKAELECSAMAIGEHSRIQKHDHYRYEKNKKALAL